MEAVSAPVLAGTVGGKEEGTGPDVFKTVNQCCRLVRQKRREGKKAKQQQRQQQDDAVAAGVKDAEEDMPSSSKPACKDDAKNKKQQTLKQAPDTDSKSQGKPSLE
jgi:hypothetical protein